MSRKKIDIIDASGAQIRHADKILADCNKLINEIRSLYIGMAADTELASVKPCTAQQRNEHSLARL